MTGKQTGLVFVTACSSLLDIYFGRDGGNLFDFRLGSIPNRSLQRPIIVFGLVLTCCQLILVTGVTHGLAFQPGRREIAVATGIAAAYFLAFVRVQLPAEPGHLIKNGVVATSQFDALTWFRNRQGRPL